MTAAASPRSKRSSSFRPASEPTQAELSARAAVVQAKAWGHLARDDRDDGPGDVIGGVGFGRAPAVPPPALDLAALCRQYLREWRQIRRRWAGIVKPTRPPEPRRQPVRPEQPCFYRGYDNRGMGRPHRSSVWAPDSCSRDVGQEG